jgi:HlyD family type I secretion membrane fusion protein
VLRRSLNSIWWLGLVVIVVFVIGGGVWAAVAPLASAAIAPGVVSPDSSRKTIQHLEGGIIREINVRQGDEVKAGQVLIRLEIVQATAAFSARREQWLRLQGMRARLTAHEAERESFDIAPLLALATAEDAEFRGFIENQARLFAVRRQGIAERTDILRQQIRQLQAEIEARKSENRGLAEQIRLLEEEERDKLELLRRNLLRRPEILALQRLMAETRARMGANDAEMARANQKIGEVELTINATYTEFRREVTDQLMRINTELSQLEEQITASGDVLKRTDIVAPVDGTVLNVKFATIGGVIRPGDAVLDIVPKGDDLVIDAKLAPTDIDVVYPGLEAQVHLLPFVSRYFPMLKGTVTRVSADSIVEQQTGQRYYEMKVRVDRDQLERAKYNMHLTPGMPAEVLVITGSRSTLEYIIEPISRSFRRAFRED